MSKYTTEVRFICESLAGNANSVGGNGIENVINQAIPQIFDFNFPIFDESYRTLLASKILKHYYTREIGYETYGLWKFNLGVRLNEIMPYYNQLYKSTLLEFNPLYDVDYTRTHERERNTEETEESNHTVNVDNSGDSTSNYSGDTTNQYSGNTKNDYSGNSQVETSVTNTSNSQDLYSDTPQGTVGNLADGTYLTNARIKNESNNSETESSTTESGSSTSIDSGNSTTSNTGNNTTVSTNTRNEVGNNSTNNVVKDVDSFLETVKGKMGGSDYSEKLLTYRQTFLNIDLMVIEALSDLFLNLW